MPSSAGIQANYRDLRRIGAPIIDQERDGTDLISPAAMDRIRVEGIFLMGAEALDSYEIFETGEIVAWNKLIVRLLPHSHSPFSSHSDVLFTLDYVYADTRREDFVILLRGRDPATGSEDYIVVWSTEEGNTRVLTQRASIETIASILELERRAD